MTINVSPALLEPYNSYEFRNLPKESFRGASTEFSRFPTGLDSEEELEELKLAIHESVFKELDRIDHAIFSDFDNKNIQKESIMEKSLLSNYLEIRDLFFQKPEK